MANHLRNRVGLVLRALLALTIVATACGNDDGGVAEDASTFDSAAFCAEAAELDVEVPESYVGSAEHVDDLRRLRSTAPTEIRDDLDLVVAHFDESVDPAQPDSQLTENFPDDVNDAIERIVAVVEETCAE